MPESPTLNQLLEAGFALEVSRFTDVPVGPGDQVLYMDPQLDFRTFQRDFPPVGCIPRNRGKV